MSCSKDVSRRRRIDELTGWMECYSRHGMHMGFCDVLDNDGNIEVPGANRLVIRRGHKAPVFVDERDGVHRSKMLVVFLGDFSGVHIVLALHSVGKC